MQDRQFSEVEKSAFVHAVERTKSQVALVSTTGTILYANSAISYFFTRTTDQSIISANILDWIPADVVKMMLDAISANHKFRCACNILLKNIPHYVTIDCAPGAPKDAPSCDSFMMTLLDTTNAKRLESAETQAQRSRVMMESLGTICHAIGQPATVVMGVLDFLRLGQATPQQSKDMINMGYEAILELRELLHQLNEKRYYVTESYLPGNDTGGSILQVDNE